jgi:hypothetical protein
LFILMSIGGVALMILGTRANNQRAARLVTVERELVETRKGRAESEVRLNRLFASASQRIRDLEQQVDAERESAANAEAEVLRQGRLAPRTVTPSQVRIMVAALSGFEGEVVTLLIQTGSDETFRFSGQVQAILAKAGLKVIEGGGAQLPFPNGISLAVGGKRAALAAAIRAALLEAKIADSVPLQPANNPDELSVMVGTRRI